jgi:hypothetical protein
VRALERNKYGKSGSGSTTRSGPRRHGGESGSSVIPEEALIKWQVLRHSVLEDVQKARKPVVLFFIEEGVDAVDGARMIHDEGLATMSKDGEAMFLIVEHNPDRTPSMDTGSPIPTSKLASPNPGRDYNVSRYPTVLVCDWHGNISREFNRLPTVRDLTREIERVSENMERLEQRLQSNLDRAKEALERDDVRNFLRSVMNNFREGVVGLSAQEESIKLYRELMDKTRDEISDILADRPEDGLSRLRNMSRDFRETELRREIEDAIAIIRR